MKVHIPQLNAAQKRAIKEEAQAQIKELLPLVTHNVEAIILWQLHVQFGFGEKRLKKFFDETAPMINDMLEFYNYESDEDAIWVCKHKLKEELGIDLDELVSPFKATFEYR